MKKKNASGGSTPRLPKYIITLEVILSRGDTGLNQLEAFKIYGETCLHSTISTLANNHGLGFSRVREPHKNRNGGVVHFVRYKITTGSIELAVKLLNHYLGGGK